jgi:multidrug efflux pump subunit AcrA (membrane-fusion protein)
VCYVLERGRLRPREVELGPSNPDHVVIDRGLQPGERVALRDPSAPSSDFGSGAAAP